jgi:uncharacterized protein YndB with AHSA1/START domain
MVSELKIAVVTYIASTAARIWDALTNPEITQQYWFGIRIESDWKVGSKVLYRRNGKITDEQTLLKFEPPHVLSYTFNPLFEEFRGERPSRVTFELAAGGGVVRLTTTHDEFEPNNKVYHACSDGWPMIISNLKTLLETGRLLPEFKLTPQLEKFQIS